MARGVRWYLLGSVVFSAVAVLAGCSGGHFMAEREAWRHEAEATCLNAGAVREGEGKVRIKAINGPGMCGADFPLKVSSLGDSAPLAFFWGEARPPAAIPNAAQGAAMPRWPNDGRGLNDDLPYDPQAVAPPPGYPPPPASYPDGTPQRYPSAPIETRPLGAPAGAPPYNPRGEPLTLDPRAAPAPEVYDFRRPYGQVRPQQRGLGAPIDANSPAYDLSPEPYDKRRAIDEPRNRQRRADPPLGGWRGPPPPAPGPSRAPETAMAGPVSVNPPATLACPVISALDQWISGAVQPAALKWLGQPVIEIKQISAYSCRGMNGDPNAHISEHAFGNALDIAAFTLADGHRLTVKDGWHGTPEEQAFLRDVQAAACAQFTTVLAPGSNRFHYDHIHVDLMRRASGRRACNPHAVSGEEFAGRLRGVYGSRGGEITGAVKRGKRLPPNAYSEVKSGRKLPSAVPGEDGED
jgi:Extensin-like protein C-terminus